MDNVFIKEKSFVAKLAAKKLHADNCAIVFRKTIFLYNISKEEIEKNKALLNHELTHILQWRKHGILLFPLLYLYYSLKYGYNQNPFEIEARNNEENDRLIENFKIL